jgi:basic amino acid/polyamine antiporter, APA family
LKNTLNNSTLKRELSLFSATVLVIANMVGTGIFTTSGFIIAELGNPNTMLAAWVVGGVFALCGALCYGELGAMFPKAGGEYVFLREAFGKGIAFLSGWISLIVGFSAPIAAAAIAFAGYCFRVAPISASIEYTMSFFGVRILTLSPVTLLAVAAIIAVSLIHYHSLRLGTGVQNGLTLFKISFILALVVGGLFMGHGSTAHFSADLDVSSVFQDKFAVSLIFIAFAYSGWNAAAYLGGEIQNPGSNIPLALFVGTLVVTGLYVALNVVYVYALPVQQMSGVMEVGAESAIALFGPHISRYFSAAIAVGLLSVLSAMVMTGPRVYYAMAKDRVFFERLGKVDRLHRTPAHAIFLQGAVAIAMALTASFDKLLIYIGFTLSLCAIATVAGLMVLRITQPGAKRPYRTLGYPLTPALFMAGNLWIVFFSLKSRPVASLFGLATIGAGICVYWYFNFRKNRNHEHAKT